MTARVAAFRVDATRQIGGGHAVRCLTLARALLAGGWRVRFYVNDQFGTAVPASISEGVEIERLGDPDAFAPLLARDWPGGVDLLVFDHYGLDARHEAPAAAHARCTLAIDDLADRSHVCDLLLDQTVGREAGAYAGLVPPHCAFLIGGRYSLLRDAFAAARPAALARRGHVPATSRLLVSMGLTDVGGITGELMDAIGTGHPFAQIDVILSTAAPSWEGVRARAEKDLRLHLRAAGSCDVVALMSEASLAIGSAGTTSWERCCLGLPTVMLKLADNQTLVVRELVAAGAAMIAESAESAARAAIRLADDPAGYAHMVSRAAALVDGQGVRRVLDAVDEFLRS